MGAGGAAFILFAMSEALTIGLGVANLWRSAHGTRLRTASLFWEFGDVWGSLEFASATWRKRSYASILPPPRGARCPLLCLPPFTRVDWNLSWKIT